MLLSSFGPWKFAAGEMNRGCCFEGRGREIGESEARQGRVCNVLSSRKMGDKWTSDYLVSVWVWGRLLSMFRAIELHICLAFSWSCGSWAFSASSVRASLCMVRSKDLLRDRRARLHCVKCLVLLIMFPPCKGKLFCAVACQRGFFFPIHDANLDNLLPQKCHVLRPLPFVQ
jgi:hypothetical protein